MDEPAVAPLVLVLVVEENLHATLQLDTQHAIWVKVGLTSEARGPIYYSDSKPVTIFARSIVTRKIRWCCSIWIGTAPKQIWLGLPKKNERLIRIIDTQRMQRRVDLHCTLSPVLPD